MKKYSLQRDYKKTKQHNTCILEALWENSYASFTPNKFYNNLLPTVRLEYLKTVGSNGCRIQFLQSDRTVGGVNEPLINPFYAMWQSLSKNRSGWTDLKCMHQG